MWGGGDGIAAEHPERTTAGGLYGKEDGSEAVLWGRIFLCRRQKNTAARHANVCRAAVMFKD